MFKNYLLASLRSFKKNKPVSLINIFGLSIGLSIFILISLFITDEKKYDQFQSKKDHIYRVDLDMGRDFDNPLTPKPFAAAAQQQIPEIISTVRIEKDRSPRALYVYGNKRFNETNYIYADSSIFRIFDFHFLTGTPISSLSEPYSMVINRSTALKYFNSIDGALNKTIHKEGTSNYYKITGVVEDYPTQSHFHFDFIISFASLSKEHDQNWMIPYMFTYVILRNDASIQEVEKKLTKIQIQNFASQLQQQSGVSYIDFLKKNKHDIRIYLEPLSSIHLYSHHRVELENNGSDQTVRLFRLVALLILALSAMNFINLATASASSRAKEIGVRKIVGAEKTDLIKQFLLESYTLCLFCLLLSIVISFILLPVLNEVSEKHLSLVMMMSYQWIIFLILLWVTVGAIAGFYPAIYLATLKATETIKKGLITYGAHFTLRRILVVSQFIIAIGLILAVLIIHRQVEYMNTKDLGFDKNQLIILPIRANVSTSQLETFKQQIKQNSSISNVSLMNYIPGKEAYENQDVFIPEGKPIEEMVPLWYIRGDWDLVSTMGFHLLKGRDFNPSYSKDSFSYILNEEAVKKMGWTIENSIGKEVSTFGNGPKDIIKGRVIGVVKNFNFENFSQPIKPMLLGVNSHYWWNLIVRINNKDVAATLSFLNTKWNELQPQFPFEYQFVDQNFAQLWKADVQMHKVLNFLMFIAVLIAIIGLFGQSIFSVHQRIKEIGIRKVLGSTGIQIITILTKEYIIMILIAFIIAAPITLYLTRRWLNAFVYRIDITADLFVLSFVSITLITLFTVGIKSYQASITNPVQTLRNN